MPTKKQSQFNELTKAELEIMQIVWEINKEFIVRNVHDKFNEPKPAYNTVSTIVRILDSKGFLVHKSYGRTNVYQAAVSKEEYTNSYMHGVLSNFFDGSLSRLVTFFSQRKDISLKEADEILEIMNHLKQN